MIFPPPIRNVLPPSSLNVLRSLANVHLAIQSVPD
jgi:hypothetical protein